MSQNLEATRLVVGEIAGLRDHIGDGLGECYCSQCERDRAIVARRLWPVTQNWRGC